MPRVHRHRLEAKPQRLRRAIQAACAVLANGYLVGFLRGEIFTGPSKAVCLPILNCYSCPGALGACPIGALQNTLGGMWRSVPFYVLGSLMLFGVLVGRLVCGFLCPFGFLQDLLHKIPTPKVRVGRRIDRVLRWVKYVMLFGVVIGMSLAVTTKAGTTPPFFCEFICPAGTLEAGIPLLLADPTLRSAIGLLFDWKVLVLGVVLVAAVLIPRPFCRYLCPLGALYGLFNRLSFYRLRVDKGRCVDCGRCDRVCPMAVSVRRVPNSAECIRCGACKRVCPAEAIGSSWEWSLTPGEALKPFSQK